MRVTGLHTIPLLALLLAAAPVTAADYLYTPQPAANEAAADGIRVREITVKKGDTLSGLSRQYNGRGHYYPQILLFNQIKNPHLIHPGQVVRVPLGKQKAAADRQAAAAAEQKPAAAAPETADTPVKQPQPEKQKHPQKATAPAGERHAFQAAQASFKKGDCAQAIKQFDSFINRYPSSTLLPEATLNRAECYLKLSAK